MSLLITRNYAANTTLTEAQLDAAFDSIETKFNTTLIAGSEIQDNAIEADNIASNAVTTVKINDGAVNAAKLASSAVETAKINDLAVTTAKINDLAVTAAKIDAGAVTTAKIADATVTGAKIEASPTITTSVKISSSGPTLTAVSSKSLGISDGSTVLSAVTGGSAGEAFKIIRGRVDSDGTLLTGEGYSSVRNSTGNYSVTFTAAFSAAPVVVVSGTDTGGIVAVTTSISTSGFNVGTKVCNTAADSNSRFTFIAVGPR